MKNLLFLLSLVALLISFYLTINHFSGELPVCGEVGSCEEVLTSKYSEIGGVPLALLGLLYDIGLIGLIGLLLFKKVRLKLVKAYIATGLLVSLSLMFVQFFVIDSFCVWCTTHAIIIILISIFGFRLKR